MPSRMFQGVVLQRKDSVNRMVGVGDGEGTVVACSELTCIGATPLESSRQYI